MNMVRAAGALALIASASSMASAAEPVQASLSLTKLNYTLTSLDPASGATPSLSTQASSVFSLFVKPFRGHTFTDSVSTGMLPGDYFDQATSTVALPSGLASASKEGNSRVVNVALSTSDLLNPSPSISSPDNVYAQVKTYADFVLSAHTSLRITADLLVTTQIDTAAISALNAGSPDGLTVLVETTFSPYVIGSENAPISTNANVTSPYGEYWSMDTSVSQTFVGGLPGAADTQPLSSQVELVITNDNDIEAAFSLSSITYARALAYTTAVPEPGTWALMALGLVGVAVAARRRSA